MALCSASEVRELVQGLPADADLLLNTLIGRAGTALARHCGYPGTNPSMEETEYTRYVGDGYVRWEDSQKIVLSVFPVISITSIHEDSDWEYGADTLVSASDYLLRGEGSEQIILKPNSTHGGWSSAPQEVRVVWRAGFATPPGDLKQACAELVAHWYGGTRGRRGLSSASDAAGSQSFLSAKIPDHVREMVDIFCLPGILI